MYEANLSLTNTKRSTHLNYIFLLTPKIVYLELTRNVQYNNVVEVQILTLFEENFDKLTD